MHYAEPVGLLRNRRSRAGQPAPVVLLVLAVLVGARASSSAGQEAVNLGAEAACLGLSEAECCAQTLATHRYGVTRAPLAEKPKLVADLICRAATKGAAEERNPGAKTGQEAGEKTRAASGGRLAPKACHSLLTAIGRPVAQAKRVCRSKGLAQRCERDAACKACAVAMGKLGFTGAEPACLALTYRPAEKARGKVVLGPKSTGGQGAIIKKRRVLK